MALAQIWSFWIRNWILYRFENWFWKNFGYKLICDSFDFPGILEFKKYQIFRAEIIFINQESRSNLKWKIEDEWNFSEIVTLKLNQWNFWSKKFETERISAPKHSRWENLGNEMIFWKGLSEIWIRKNWDFGENWDNLSYEKLRNKMVFVGQKLQSEKIYMSYGVKVQFWRKKQS